jgi:hypothetical protein
MTKKLKLHIVDEKPYLVSLDKIEIGDKVIMTVGGQYPSLIDCRNEQTLKLVVDSKLSLNQAFKVFAEPDKVNLTQEQIDKLIETDGVLEVEIENGEVIYK